MAATTGDEDAQDADALRLRLQVLLPAIREAEQSLERQRREHAALLETAAAAEATRDALQGALTAPLCVAQAAVNRALEEVGTLDKKAVGEVKGMTSPPKHVILALALVHGILFAADGKAAAPSWPELQKMLRQQNFLARVRGFRVQGSHVMQDATLARLRKVTANLTDEVVHRANKAVASLYAWAKAQLELAPLVKDSETAKGARTGDLQGQLSAAEAARTKMGALAAVCDLQGMLSSGGLAAPVAVSDMIRSQKDGPDAVAALGQQLRGAETLLAELEKRCHSKFEAIQGTQEHLRATELQSKELEEQISVIASAVRAGPPLCDCGEEMVRRECTDLMNPMYGRSCWRCPRGSRGCGRRDWDDAPANAELPRTLAG